MLSITYTLMAQYMRVCINIFQLSGSWHVYNVAQAHTFKVHTIKFAPICAQKSFPKLNYRVSDVIRLVKMAVGHITKTFLSICVHAVHDVHFVLILCVLTHLHRQGMVPKSSCQIPQAGEATAKGARPICDTVLQRHDAQHPRLQCFARVSAVSASELDQPLSTGENHWFVHTLHARL